ncbi:MAG: SpoIIE family protein phosphatase [Aeromicrobium sp.]|uniref:SpoIIE family protein phosphatase n=1 Tax=Aeromicrobium sp. TaxID=1871063 RepID=UPI0026079898|nr:SpoIIE family protein phosphatase [Aeromicrobium sp.]MDF1704381.1 SpoIIE family protein phosphatase [Aeromicrobium sp.]
MTRDVFAAASPELRAVYDAVDWASTSLGPVSTWSTSLRDVVDLMLHSHFPMTLLWGEDFVLVYNDAYAPMIGEKHPAALGATSQETFGEAWDQIGPMMQAVATTGQAHLVEDALVPLVRNGFLEDCYFTFSYSPVRGEDSQVEGVIDVVAETTRAVLGRRRLEVLARLAEALAGASTLDEVKRRSLRVFRGFDADVVDVELQLADATQADWSDEPHWEPPRPIYAGEVVTDSSADGREIIWVALEADAEERATSTLVMELNPRVLLDDDLVDFVRLTGSVVGRALGRARAEAIEREHADQERRLSETLQRSLLSQPAQPDGVRVAVRYVPAAEDAQVGGDWYDAFCLPSDDLCVVIGDVTGHDRDAAAGMAQLRNLVRGVAMTADGTPAEVLSSVEQAVEGLEIEVIATSIVARLQLIDDAHFRAATLRWSNAGHLPPVVIEPDGSVRILDRHPDPLVGIGAWERADHVETLAPGSAVVFFTDGLIERRGQSIDAGLAWLEQALSGQQHRDTDELCDLLIGHMPPDIDDDVALLVLKVQDSAA